MGFGRVKYMLSNFFGVQWRMNKHLFIWLGIFVSIGIVIGFAVVFTPNIKVTSISNNLLDRNILIVIRPNQGIGSFIIRRLLDFSLISGLVFAVCLHRWTVLFAFVLGAYKGFSLVINLWWCFAKFGAALGTVLFIFYLVWLLLLLVIFVCAIIYLLRSCAVIRQGGFRGGMRWKDFGKGCLVFVGVVATVAVAEWLGYWIVLSKFVFVV